MMDREEDRQDKRIPLMLWWTLESKAESDRDALLALFRDAAVWQKPLARTHGAHHLAQRWAMAGGKENFDACAKLLASAPRAEDRALVVEGLADAFEGGKIPELPPALATALNAHLASKLDSDLALAVKTGNAEAAKKAIAIIRDDKTSTANRVALVQAFADAGNREVIPAILQVFSRPGNPTVRQALLPVAAKFADPALAAAVLKTYESRFSQTAPLKDATHRMLASRREWAKLFLAEIDRWQIRAQDVAPDIVRQMELYQDPELDRSIRKHWPSAATKLSSQEKIAEMQRIRKSSAPVGATPRRAKRITRSAVHRATCSSTKARRLDRTSRATSATTRISGCSRFSIRAWRSAKASARTPPNSRTVRRSWACWWRRTRAMSC